MLLPGLLIVNLIGLKELLLTPRCFPQHTNARICAGTSVVYIPCMELTNHKTQTFKMLLDICQITLRKRCINILQAPVVYVNACFAMFHQPLFPPTQSPIFLIIKPTSYTVVTTLLCSRHCSKASFVLFI